MNCARYVIGLILSAALVTDALALGISNQHLEQVAALDTRVKSVIRCGNWEESGVFGYYRVVLVDYFDVGTEIYVQRISTGMTPSGKAIESVVETISFPEFNNDHAEYYLEHPVCQEIKNGIALRINALSGNEQIKEDDGKRKVTITVRAVRSTRVEITRPDASSSPTPPGVTTR